jgi:uncharacterized protein (TIGR03437 family)
MALRFRYALPALLAVVAHAQNVLTGGYDSARGNADISENYLTPQTVSPSQFGKLFTLPANGQIYAQPLYQSNLTIGGAAHNVVFIATAHNSVYAYDADTAGSPLWTVNLGPSVPTVNYNAADPAGYSDILPENGILGTPVIDASTGTLYVVAAIYQNGIYAYWLHALDTGSGAEKFNAPKQIYAEVPGSGEDTQDGIVAFNAQQEIQRPALLLLNGVVYIAFGSHGDGGAWHGWIIGYRASNVVQQTAVFNATPNGYGGSIWQSGRGLSADTQGSIYAVTANGSTDDVTAYSENVLRLNPDLSVADWFSPSDYQTLNNDDEDLGASGAILLPGTNQLVTGGKQGMAYLLNTSNLGHTSGNDAQIPQSFNAGNIGIFNMAFWNSSLYMFGGSGPIEAFPFSGGQFQTTPSSQSSSGYAVPYYGITVSANGNTPGSGIVWVTTADTNPLPSSGTLHAYDAGDLSSELWNSSVNGDRDALGTFVKFVNPTVANGKVYTPTLDNQLVVYGLLGTGAGGGAAAPVVTGLVNAANYANGAIAPGEIVDIFGQNLGPRSLATGAHDESGNMLTDLAGIEVTFNGVPAPIVYASGPVMAVIVPFEVSAANQADMQVTYDGVPSKLITLNVVPSAPGIFTINSAGNGQAAILNGDYSVNSDANPAAQGSYISVYATGGGQTSPPDSTGALAQGIAQVTLPVTATIGGQPAQVLYAGHAPEEVAGVMQVNLQVPAGVTGDQPVVITIGGVATQANAMVAIQ